MTRLLVMLGMLSACMIGGGAVSSAAEESSRPTETVEEESSAKESGAKQRPFLRLDERFLGSTPEARTSLEAARERLSAAAAALGTDPTAITGFYQTAYVHNELTNGVRRDVATATVRIPIRRDWLLQVNMPYVWADQDLSNSFPVRGAGDMTMRAGARVYADDKVAFFLGADAWFPTASGRQLGAGKYLVGPGGSMAMPLARWKSLLFLLAGDFNSVGGDPSRANIHFTRVQSFINTIWSERWWSLVSMTWDIDWNDNRSTAMNVLGQAGYQFDKQWTLFAGPGVGVVGWGTAQGLEWTMETGIRWVYSTPLIPDRLFGGTSEK